MGPQIKDVGQMPGHRRQQPRPAPGREQQTGVMQPTAVGQLQSMLLRIEVFHRVTGQVLDVQFGELSAIAQTATRQFNRAL
ncbi:hypothetical protein D3C78_1743600 [compost metagenome]